MAVEVVVQQQAIAFGPVPSRRLGRSLGINNIPVKHCSYSCVYCQVGRTPNRETSRRSFLPPCHVVHEVERRVAACRSQGLRIDYLAFVPDGEPTLDVHLGRELRDLGSLGIPRAVLTNGSLLDRDDVRAELEASELVSVKVDAGDEATWRRIDRPAGGLEFDRLRAGIREFARSYRGRFVTETMLVAGVNDLPEAVAATTELLVELQPARCYLAVPTRPPAVAGAHPPGAASLVRAFQILATRLGEVELLTVDETGPFDRTGDAVGDLLAILAVHPMREMVAREYLDAGHEPDALARLLSAGSVTRVEYLGESFLVRPAPRFAARDATGDEGRAS